MFDLGIQELIVIFIVALLVFGPNRLPELGRSLGKGIAELKRAMQGIKEQVDAEMKDIKQPLTLDDGIYKKPQKEEPVVKADAGTQVHTAAADKAPEQAKGADKG
jgi:sec-independent protein translocase protein TatB